MPEGENTSAEPREMKQGLLDYPYPEEVLEIVATLKEQGFSCFLVGGCVRDILMKVAPVDYDLATDATPEQSMALFERTIPTGLKFGTITVMKGKKGYELTTFRGDGAYHDGRRPKIVSFKKDIKEDLSRRDFTVNAVAYDPQDRVLVDAFGGIPDLAAGLIRTVGKAEERLLEDGLRIMRAFRFMYLGRLDQELVEAIRKHRSILEKISRERIRVEFVKLMSCSRPTPIIEAMGEAGLFRIIYNPLTRLQENSGLWKHILDSILKLPTVDHIPRSALLFSCLGFRDELCGQGIPELAGMEVSVLKKAFAKSSRETAKLLQENCYSKKEMKDISTLVADMWVPYPLLQEEGLTTGQLRVAKVNYRETLASAILCALARERAAARPGLVEALLRLEERLDEVLVEGHLEPAIDGKTIMEELGIPPSRKVGVLKDELYQFQLETNTLDRELLLKELRRLAGM